MQIAILLYEKVTALDAVGPYEVLSRLPGVELVFVGERRGSVRTDTGRLSLGVDATLAEVPRPDIVVVPGGPVQRMHTDDGPVHQWLRAVDATSTWTTSVCTGSLILATAGLLKGRKATTHWLDMERLERLGVTPTTERVVIDGKYITAAGVSSGIDMALTLIGRVAGDMPAQAIQLGIEYDPQPPYDAGSPAKAPPEVVEMLRARSQEGLHGTQAHPA